MSRNDFVGVMSVLMLAIGLATPLPAASQQPEVAKTLYVTAGKTLYKVRTTIAGLPR